MSRRLPRIQDAPSWNAPRLCIIGLPGRFSAAQAHALISQRAVSHKQVRPCRPNEFRDAAPPTSPSASAPPAQKPAPGQTAGFWPFGKKKPKAKPRVGDKTIYWFPHASSHTMVDRNPYGAMTKRGHGMMGAGRRRRRRRR